MKRIVYLLASLCFTLTMMAQAPGEPQDFAPGESLDFAPGEPQDVAPGEAHSHAPGEPQSSSDDAVFSKAITHLNGDKAKNNDNANGGKTKKKSQPELWAILLADTEDVSIGQDDALDNKSVLNELTGICNALGIKSHITNITGANTYKKSVISNAIDNIKPKADDIVIFWFNGHGFRWDDQKDQYPQLYLGESSNSVGMNYMSSTDIYRALTAKGARLNLVFADCCNSKAGCFAPLQKGSSVYSKAVSISRDRLADLFLNQAGNTLAAAAQPGEYAFSFSNYGSAFTQAILKALKEEVAEQNTSEVSWTNIVDTAIRAAREKTTGCENTQHGIRYMNTHKITR